MTWPGKATGRNWIQPAAAASPELDVARPDPDGEQDILLFERESWAALECLSAARLVGMQAEAWKMAEVAVEVRG